MVADSASVAHFVVSEITSHPNWSLVSSLDANRIMTTKGHTQHTADTADFKKEHLPALKPISIPCNGRNNILKVMSIRAIGEAKKQVSQSSQRLFLYELKHDLTKFHGNRIVKNKIYQALSAITGLVPLHLAG